MQSKSIKRLFFGFEVHAPWPIQLPLGRLLDPPHRHMTLAFLGEISIQKIEKALSTIPKPSFKVGLAGKFDQCLFLPHRHPRVVAWHMDWIERSSPLITYQQEIAVWLKEHDFSFDQKYPFMPHVTLARFPFDRQEWSAAFHPLPFFTLDLHLFESVGHSKYTSLWNYSLIPPFEEIEHTADRAYIIYGETLLHIFQHAQLALTFEYPELLPFFFTHQTIESIEDIVIILNEFITKADQHMGCPFKAVSFHGKLVHKNNLLSWEMIIDV